MNPKYIELIDSNDVICPYCGEAYQPEGEDYSEDESIEECEGCGKSFITFQSFTIDHHAIPDCDLNNEDHEYVPIELSNGKTHDFCSICDKCKPYKRGE